MKLEHIIHLKQKLLQEKIHIMYHHLLRVLLKMHQLLQQFINGIKKQLQKQIISLHYHLKDITQQQEQAKLNGEIGQIGQLRIQKLVMEEIEV